MILPTYPDDLVWYPSGHTSGVDAHGQWHGTTHVCALEPRLRRMFRIWVRRTMPASTIYTVDGQDAGSYQDACAFLQSYPIPSVSVQERELLRTIPTEWADSHVARSNLQSLIDKGLIEVSPDPRLMVRRMVRRTASSQHIINEGQYDAA